MSRHGGRGVIAAGLISSVVPYLLKTDDNPEGTPQSVFDDIAEGIQKDPPISLGKLSFRNFSEWE